MATLIDQASAIRAGETLELEKLAAFLQTQLADANEPVTVEQFPRGFSNLTYLLRLGKRELVLRRPPFGANIKSAHDMGREYRILRALSPVYPKAPAPLLYCEDPSVLGAPFYIMERVQGVILRTQIPPELGVTPATLRRMSESLIDTLAELHAVDYQAAGLGDLGKPEGYVERQVSGWSKRYQNARTHDLPEMEAAAVWLTAHLPKTSAAALIHNDFKYDNVILSPDNLSQIIAVLDWEMATIGDPLMDVGSTLSYWAQADDLPALRNFGITALPGNLNRHEFVARYAEKSGRDLSNILFYYVFGLFKLGVIIQQIYFRYRQGFTQDARFAHLDQLVEACAKTAARGIERGKIGD